MSPSSASSTIVVNARPISIRDLTGALPRWPRQKHHHRELQQMFDHGNHLRRTVGLVLYRRYIAGVRSRKGRGKYRHT